MFYVVISEKGGAERREAFDKAVVTVGRVQDNDLALAKGNVSKRHCRIESADGRFIVTDEDSTNGTYVNRRRITAPTIVREGDRIYVGDFVLRVETTPSTDGSLEVPPLTPVPVPVIAQVLPHGTENDAGADFSRPSVTTESSRAPMGHSPSKPARRTDAVSAFPSSSSELLVGAPTGSAGGGERAAARTLIEEVWQRLEPKALERVIDAETSDRISRILAEQVQQLASHGHVLTAAATEHAVQLARSELLGLGPLEVSLGDPRATEILVTGVRRLHVNKDGVLQGATPFCHPEAVEWAVARLCRLSGSEARDQERVLQRYIDAQGLRLDAARSSVAPEGALLRLTRTEVTATALDDLVHVGTLSRAMATFLKHCCLARLNILVVGKPHSGYQEVMNALAGVSEPPLAWLSWMGEHSRSPAGLDAQLVRCSPADVGEVLDLLLNMGHRVIAPNPRADEIPALITAVTRGLDGLVVGQAGSSMTTTLTHWSHQLATPQVGAAEAYKLLTRAVDVVIEVARLGDGRSRVLRVAELRHRDGAIRDIFDFVVERTASGGSIEGHFRGVGEPPELLTTLRARGVVLDDSLFLRPPSE